MSTVGESADLSPERMDIVFTIAKTCTGYFSKIYTIPGKKSDIDIAMEKTSFLVNHQDMAIFFHGYVSLARYRYAIRTSYAIYFLDTLPKTNMDTQNDGLEKVTPVKMSIVGIYVRFLGCSASRKSLQFFLTLCFHQSWGVFLSLGQKSWDSFKHVLLRKLT